MRSVYLILFCMLSILAVSDAIASYRFVIGGFDQNTVTYEIAPIMNFTCEIIQIVSTSPNGNNAIYPSTECALYSDNGSWFVFVSYTSNSCVIQCDTNEPFNQNFWGNITMITASQTGSGSICGTNLLMIGLTCLCILLGFIGV
jgi:hypothetical protein